MSVTSPDLEWVNLLGISPPLFCLSACMRPVPLILSSLHCPSVFPACSDGWLEVFNERQHSGQPGEFSLS